MQVALDGAHKVMSNQANTVCLVMCESVSGYYSDITQLTNKVMMMMNLYNSAPP